MDGKRSSVNSSLLISFLLAFSLVKKKPKSFIDRKCAPKKNYPLQCTDRIISLVIGNDIWSNFIPTLCKIPTK